MASIIHREQMPDGTVKLWYDDGSTQIVGTAVDPVERGRQAGAAAAAQTSAQYGDPWYQENVLGPMNLAASEQAKDRAAQLHNQAATLKQQGRTAEANAAYQKAQVELRKSELLQNDRQFGQTLQQRQVEFDRGQQLSANLALGQMRGPGNAAQFIDTGRRLGSMGISSTALGQIAAGGMPQGAFAPGQAGKPVSMAERMSGMMGGDPSTIDQRDANDKGLAARIAGGAGQLARGSLETLSPFERDYLGSYAEAGGNDWGSVTEAYRRAGIMQGRR